MIYRVYVEKKEPFALKAKSLLSEIQNLLGVRGAKSLRVLQRYDVEGLTKDEFAYCVKNVFSEAPVDNVFLDLPEADYICASEYLSGQFDQRADSAVQCIELLLNVRTQIKRAALYVFSGSISEEERLKIESYFINPVEAQKASLKKPASLKAKRVNIKPVKTLFNFNSLSKKKLENFLEAHSLAMDIEDLIFIQDYFKSEKRPPTFTEIKVLDTYWSDHCRHGTFNTALTNIDIKDAAAAKTFQKYIGARRELKRDNRPITLMDIALSAASLLKSRGELKAWDVSEEINACTIKVPVNGTDYYVLFKNETHNHPTEIEPSGGAATCIGGAIRDPLSGRAFVYQAARISGGGDPFTPLDETLKGKLPQRKIIYEAAQGFSSYGNQIGLATSVVREIYHPDYVAKRLEAGAVIGAVPVKNVKRKKPAAGDVVVLIGGRTGRDGCGGASGSSKVHKTASLTDCGAEVQKGNAVEERKLQRFFRNPNVSRMIKRCNDFGAGGVSVAAGELARGVEINLDKVPLKYEGINGTELAISESQERMAVVLNAKDLKSFIDMAKKENLLAVQIAKITKKENLVMKFKGKTIVNLSRKFLDTNGVQKEAAVSVRDCSGAVRQVLSDVCGDTAQNLTERFVRLAQDLNVCCKKGLCERFDWTIGAGTVIAPFGGKYQLTEEDVSAAKIPVSSGESDTCTVMSFAFDPFLSKADPYHAAYLSVIGSIGKLIACGASRKNIYLSLQEYFPAPKSAPERWGLPFSALLGAFAAQLDTGAAAIGGKDSMSGSFESLDVPPTLISFSFAGADGANIISSEFKKIASPVYLLRARKSAEDDVLPDAKSFLALCDFIERGVAGKKIISCRVTNRFGAAEALMKMCFGNRLGVRFEEGVAGNDLFNADCASFICEVDDESDFQNTDGAFMIQKLGATQKAYALSFNSEEIDLSIIESAYKNRYESFMPFLTQSETRAVPELPPQVQISRAARKIKSRARPLALVPVFPGTNCEYDTIRALNRAGARTETCVITNLSSAAIKASARDFAERLNACNMLILPGGFSGGDEPDGSAKLICAFLRRPQVRDAVVRFIEKDSLTLGICNGFQALIKLGLVPFGEFTEASESSPTLTFNTIGRHQSLFVRTKITSTLSPWFMREELGAVHTLPVSHGEGRFIADAALLRRLSEGGQVAACYVNLDGEIDMNLPWNPNGSMCGVEALTSPDGRILGKMAHSERCGGHLYKNISGVKYQRIFEGGVEYFRG